MNLDADPPRAAQPVEQVLCEELAHGDAMLGSVQPILRHLLANDDHTLFGDEVIARIRGMLGHVVSQMLDAAAVVRGEQDRVDHSADEVAPLVASLIAYPGVLGHAHALALEWQLTERLHARLALDVVLSPLLQSLIASNDAETSSLGMGLLASQARFAQHQRRMQLPITELPADLFRTALATLAAHRGQEGEAAASILRHKYDDSRARLGLISRLIMTMGGGATAALSLSHAGVGMFLSALALAAGLDRDTVALATNETQLARFALALRASGLKHGAVEEQFAALHPDVSLPEGFDLLGADGAAALLARSVASASG